MLAWFQRLRPRRLIVVGTVLLGLSGGFAVVLDQLRPLTVQEWGRLSAKYRLDDDRAVEGLKVVHRMIDEEGLGIYGWHLHPRWHHVYRQLDLAGLLAGFSLLACGLAYAHNERTRGLLPAP